MEQQHRPAKPRQIKKVEVINEDVTVKSLPDCHNLLLNQSLPADDGLSEFFCVSSIKVEAQKKRKGASF